MDGLNSFYSLWDSSGGFLKEFYTAYNSYFLKGALILALLNCFFGYKLRKLWSCIFGLLLGMAAGFAAGLYLNLPEKIVWVVVVAAGLIFTALAFLLYRIGMFFLCIGVVIMTLFQLFPMPTFSTICGFVVFGIVIGFLAITKEHIVVICITSICGGIASARLIMQILSNSSTVLTILLAVALSALGLVLQFKPWKKKDYWKKKEARNARKRKAKGGKTFLRKSKASKKKAKRGSGKGTPETKYQNQEQKKRRTNPETSSSTVVRKYPDPTPANQKSTLPAGKSEEDSYTVDLSDIRSEISKEVQDFYKEQHKSET